MQIMLLDANRRHFDHQHTDHPDARTRADRLARAIKHTRLLTPGVTTLMDFACGSGLVSRALAAEDPKSIVGVDISQRMVDQYNKTVSDHGIPPDEMRAICVSELREDEPQLRGISFDVIVCASAYHHFASIDDVTKTLVSYLKPGGSLLVADLVKGQSPHEIFPPDVHHIVAHRGGFAEEDIRSTFESAGLKNFSFEKVARARHAGHSVDLFLARGDK